MYKEIFSQERLKNYKINPSDTDEEVIARYLWNIALSEALYPAIAIFEINLRNNIYNSISKHIKKDWLDEVNTPWLLKVPRNLKYNVENKQIMDAKKQLTKLKKPHSQGQIISQLTLGFWVNMLKLQYKPDIWTKPKVFDDAFPYFNIKCSDRIAYVDPYLKRILKLRNRLFHHEPIFNHPQGLDVVFNDLLTVMSWLSADTKDLLNILNRFDKVYNSKLEKYLPARKTFMFYSKKIGQLLEQVLKAKN